MNRLLNLGLRGLTLASRFLLIFFLGRFLEPSELGLYGLFAATISYALYLLGFDFYTFSTREILKHAQNEWGAILKCQIGISIALYAVFLPLLFFVFVQELLPWRLASWFFILLILEHINQELGRLLVAISEQLTASAILFLRQGIWVAAAAILMLGDANFRQLEFVFGAWTVGGTLALVLGLWKLSQLGISGWHQSIDWRWILKGLKIAVPLLVATLAIRGVFTLDRYWFDALTSREILGAYVLYIGVCGALMAFLDAGVFAFNYPGLIKAHNQGNRAAFHVGMHKLLIQTVVLTFGFALLTVLAIGPILTWLGKPLYLEHQALLYWLLFAIALYGVGMVPHYGLYAQGKDEPIIHSHIASLIVFVLATWLLSFIWPYLAVPLGLCVAFLLILCWKAYAYLRLGLATTSTLPA